jgi:hypothetical protein
MNGRERNGTFRDIQFNEHTRNQIFQELNVRFGFPVNVWRKKFLDEMSRRPRNVSPDEFFPLFGNTFINPLLNDILCRNRLYPTFNKFVEFVVWGKQKPSGNHRVS